MKYLFSAILIIVFCCPSPVAASADIPRIEVGEGGATDYKILVHCVPQDNGNGAVIGAIVPETNFGQIEISTFDSNNLLGGRQFTHYFRKDDVVGLVAAEEDSQDSSNEIFLLINIASKLPDTEMNFVGLLDGGGVVETPLLCVLVSTNLEQNDLEGFFEEAKTQ